MGETTEKGGVCAPEQKIIYSTVNTMLTTIALFSCTFLSAFTHRLTPVLCFDCKIFWKQTFCSTFVQHLTQGGFHPCLNTMDTETVIHSESLAIKWIIQGQKNQKPCYSSSTCLWDELPAQKERKAVCIKAMK